MIVKSGTIERDLRSIYGAYEYLRGHDLADVSTTSRLLRAADLPVLARRAYDELRELHGVVDGTHGHGGGRDDAVLEAYQCIYWVLLLAVAAGDPYDRVRPHEALSGSASDDGFPTTAWESAPLADVTARAAVVRQGLARVATLCARAGITVAEAVRRDLMELREKPYLLPYWSASGPLPLPRAAVAAIAPYVPGRNAEDVRRAYGLDQVVKLASNENPFGPSPRAVEAVTRALSASNYYPDGAVVALRERLAERFGLGRENVVLGNGSDEMIMLLALAYLEAGDEAVLADPPYTIDRTYVLAMGGVLRSVPLRDHTHDLDAMAAAVTERTRLVFVSNPHNPTGTVVDEVSLRQFAARIPGSALLVVDEAYHDFVDDALRFSGRELLDEQHNIVTLRTFSKAYGLAGLRAGYALAHAEVVRTLDRIRPPFAVNSAAQAGALAALDDEEYVAAVVAQTRRGRERLLQIARQHDLEAVPSQANFVLMKVGDSRGLAGDLMARGVIVRPGENLGMPGWIRVSVGTDADIDTFEQAMGAQLAPAKEDSNGE